MLKEKLDRGPRSRGHERDIMKEVRTGKATEKETQKNANRTEIEGRAFTRMSHEKDKEKE